MQFKKGSASTPLTPWTIRDGPRARRTTSFDRAGDDEATDEDIIIGTDVRTGRDVQSLRRRISRGGKRTQLEIDLLHIKVRVTGLIASD